MVYSMWQHFDQRSLWEASKKIHIFWSTVWKLEPGTNFQTCSMSALEELWKEAEAGFKPISRRVFLTHFFYISGFSVTKLFFEERSPWLQKKKKNSRNICGCSRLNLNVSYFFPPLALLLLRLSYGIFGMKPHIQTWVWNPKAKNVWYFFPTSALEPWANERTPS